MFLASLITCETKRPVFFKSGYPVSRTDGTRSNWMTHKALYALLTTIMRNVACSACHLDRISLFIINKFATSEQFQNQNNTNNKSNNKNNNQNVLKTWVLYLIRINFRADKFSRTSSARKFLIRINFRAEKFSRRFIFAHLPQNINIRY